jgi:hypothetical protein
MRAYLPCPTVAINPPLLRFAYTTLPQSPDPSLAIIPLLRTVLFSPPQRCQRRPIVASPSAECRIQVNAVPLRRSKRTTAGPHHPRPPLAGPGAPTTHQVYTHYYLPPLTPATPPFNYQPPPSYKHSDPAWSPKPSAVCLSRTPKRCTLNGPAAAARRLHRSDIANHRRLLPALRRSTFAPAPLPPHLGTALAPLQL